MHHLPTYFVSPMHHLPTYFLTYAPPIPTYFLSPMYHLPTYFLSPMLHLYLLYVSHISFTATDCNLVIPVPMFKSSLLYSIRVICLQKHRTIYRKISSSVTCYVTNIHRVCRADILHGRNDRHTVAAHKNPRFQPTLDVRKRAFPLI